MQLTLTSDGSGVSLTRAAGPVGTPADASVFCGHVYAVLLVVQANGVPDANQRNNHAAQSVVLRCSNTGDASGKTRMCLIPMGRLQTKCGNRLN